MTYSKNILNQYEGFFNESHSSVSVKIGSIPFLIKRRKKGQKKRKNILICHKDDILHCQIIFY